MGIEAFIKEIEAIGIKSSDKKIEQFNKFYDLLVTWNSFMNLTGITEYEEVLLKHYIDSLYINILDEVDFNEPVKVIDIGTGAGFPGLPLKIAFENVDITLLDSLNKRIKFINEVVSNLELESVNPIHGRAEDYANNIMYRECYDYCVSRAVANLATLSEYCLPFVKIGGYFISYKSGEIDQEINESKNAIKILGGEIVEVKKIKLPESDIDRSFVVIKKVKATGKKYPRKAGLPSKEPLK